MNILKEIAVASRRRSSRTYMKKEKIPTQNKTKKCSICHKSGTTITVNNQRFVRCSEHIRQLNMRNEKYSVNFARASTL